MCCVDEIEPSGLEILGQISNIVIAILSLCFAVFIFVVQNKKDDKKGEVNRRIDALKTIVLQHNLSYLFDHFDNLIEITKDLNEKELTDDEKSEVNDKLQAKLVELRLRFIDLLLAVDSGLYTKVKNLTDELIDSITTAMFNEGLNLRHRPMFEAEVLSKISEKKTEVVKSLFDYNGENN